MGVIKGGWISPDHPRASVFFSDTSRQIIQLRSSRQVVEVPDIAPFRKRHAKSYTMSNTGDSKKLSPPNPARYKAFHSAVILLGGDL